MAKRISKKSQLARNYESMIAESNMKFFLYNSERSYDDAVYFARIGDERAAAKLFAQSHKFRADAIGWASK